MTNETQNTEQETTNQEKTIEISIGGAIQDFGKFYYQNILDSCAQKILTGRGGESNGLCLPTRINIKGNLQVLFPESFVAAFLIPGQYLRWSNTQENPLTQSIQGNDKKAEILLKTGHLEEAIFLLRKEYEEGNSYDKDVAYYGIGRLRYPLSIYDSKENKAMTAVRCDESLFGTEYFCFSRFNIGNRIAYEPHIWVIDPNRQSRIKTRLDELLDTFAKT